MCKQKKKNGDRHTQNAYSVRTSGCTANIVYWRHSMVPHQPVTQGHTVWPTESIVKYITRKHTEN